MSAESLSSDWISTKPATSRCIIVQSVMVIIPSPSVSPSINNFSSALIQFGKKANVQTNQRFIIQLHANPSDNDHIYTLSEKEHKCNYAILMIEFFFPILYCFFACPMLQLHHDQATEYQASSRVWVYHR